ncbi:piggyBac transposable element-derived protein 3-like [Schistocerca cancellata]|uniref:piggyBac transposable element-derived protein 3-like n=1 Tax=Schistocerca cancellata TaxID=274614 RepID=UPI002119657F|nr:piggyBac transposable element-derived protein 3-like [Schistocerca cancellata]
MVIEHLRTSNLTPIHLFRYVFGAELVEIPTRDIVKYAAQKGHNIQISQDDIYKDIAILLLSGYCKSISRNTFDKIHRFFHVNDNDSIEKDDKVYKVRPLISHLNKKFQDIIIETLGSNFCLDEAMEPYYGYHFMEQFIRGKPICCGFKCQRDPHKLLGHSVVEKLCVGYIPQNSTEYIDNYFNFFPTCTHARYKEGPTHVLPDTGNSVTLERLNDTSQVTRGTNEWSYARIN